MSPWIPKWALGLWCSLINSRSNLLKVTKCFGLFNFNFEVLVILAAHRYRLTSKVKGSIPGGYTKIYPWCTVSPKIPPALIRKNIGYTPNLSTYNSVRWPIFPFDAFVFCVYKHTVIVKSIVCTLGVSIRRIHHSRWLQERQTCQGFIQQHLITQ